MPDKGECDLYLPRKFQDENLTKGQIQISSLTTNSITSGSCNRGCKRDRNVTRLIDLEKMLQHVTQNEVVLPFT